MLKRSVIIGTGSYLPANVVTNKDLESKVDTSDEWIFQRTGIKQRHVAAEGETTFDMALEAGRAAMKAAGVTGKEIDGVIVATTTPDTTFPSVAAKVQAALNINVGPAFDVQAVCAGFIYALSVADSLMRTSHQAKRYLVIGADKMTSILDWEDRTTCVLFADGAGAVVLETQDSTGTLEDRGIISTHIYADGQFTDILKTSGGTSSTGHSGFIQMQGKEVFRNAVHFMSDVVNEVLVHNKISPDQIDYLVPHQANIRIIEGTAKKLDMDMDRVVVTVQDHGNTSAASIPLALDVAVKDGRIQKDHLILLEGLGAGLAWGAALIRF
jgi:3-oxoacyl-[acyl-carrier-protein] synthase-3